jgi:hypothetical protein
MRQILYVENIYTIYTIYSQNYPENINSWKHVTYNLQDNSTVHFSPLHLIYTWAYVKQLHLRDGLWKIYILKIILLCVCIYTYI